MPLIRHVWVGLLTLLGAVVVCGAVGTYALARTDRADATAWDLGNSARIVHELRGHLDGLASAEASYLLDPRPELIDQRTTHQRDFERALRRLRQTSPHGSELAADVEPRYLALADSSDRALALAREGQGSEARLQLLGTVASRRQALDALLADEETRVTAEADRAHQAAGEVEAAWRAAIVGLTIGGLLLGAGLSLIGLRQFARRLGHSISAIAAASHDFSSTVERSARGSSEQAAAVQQMSTAMERLSQAAEQIALAAEQTLAGAEEGRAAVDDVSNGMDRAKARVEVVVRQTHNLGERIHQIDEITDIIGEIAGKTHLLALNAAIESAGAGEYGRRFGVVASQVRELADDVRAATAQVKSVVAEIKSATETSAAVTADAIQEATDGSGLARRAGDAIEDIVQMIQTISVATQQQREASESVVRTMRDLSDLAQDSAADSRESATAASRLDSTASDLKLLARGVSPGLLGPVASGSDAPGPVTRAARPEGAG